MKKTTSLFLRGILILGILFLISAKADAEFTAKGGKIYHDLKPIVLKGLNWFGFETEDHVTYGLWARGYKEMIAQMKDLGFNAVRLPFCPATLDNVEITSWIDPVKNSDLIGLKSLEILDKIVSELNFSQIYILLDHHRPDCLAISELWYTDTYSAEQWIDDLKFVGERYKDVPYFMGIDLKNEPHGMATWGTGNPATDWNQAVETAAAAVLAINPDILIFVEGIGENPICSSTINHFWGENLEPQACTPIDVPSDKVIFSPHVYGPDVYDQPYFTSPDFPTNMPIIWDTHFGYLSKEGQTLAVGEFGGKYGHGGIGRDVTWQQAFVDYLITRGLCHFFYWSWNPNSGDTVGILKDDWTEIWTDKYENLKRLMDDCRCGYRLPGAIYLLIQ